MKFTSRCLVILGFTLLGCNAINAQSNGCPTINEIKAKPLDHALEYRDGRFWVSTFSNYATTSTWLFSISPIKANFGDSAIKEANALLKQMNQPGIPDDDACECTYATGKDAVFAVAVREDDLAHGYSVVRHSIR